MEFVPKNYEKTKTNKSDNLHNIYKKLYKFINIIINKMNNFNIKEYERITQTFPEISREEYSQITDEKLKWQIASKNRLLASDTYNRTMDWTKWVDNNGQATYTLSFRNNTYSYFVVDGIRSIIKEYFKWPIVQHELDFASDNFANEWSKWGIKFFNKDRRQNIVINHKWFAPLTIRAVLDGTAVKPGEPVMTVGSEDSEVAAWFEAKLLRVFYPSAVATHQKMIEELGVKWRIVDFSNRSAINDNMQFASARSNYIWWGINQTSNDAAASVYPFLRANGTLAHRYFASFDTEDEALENAIAKHDSISLLVDYIDSVSGLDKIIALKKKYPNKKIYPRLDSWDILGQTIYYLNQLKASAMLDDGEKVIISEVWSMEKLNTIENTVWEEGFDPSKYIYYGIGGLITAQKKTRDELSAAYKQTEYKWHITGKLSNDLNKSPIPGSPTIIITEDKKRVVAQLSEVLCGGIKWEDLMHMVYDHGNMNFKDDDFAEIQDARERLARTFDFVSYEWGLSDLSHQYKMDVRDNLLSQKM